MHTAGEPVRIVTGDTPALAGETVLAQRRDARESHDHLRRAMMLEPRGHEGMYGVIPVRAVPPRAPFSACSSCITRAIPPCAATPRSPGPMGGGAGARARGRAGDPIHDRAPCGPLRPVLHVRERGRDPVTFESVPAFVHALDRRGRGGRESVGSSPTSRYGGAFYAILPADSARAGFLRRAPLRICRGAAGALTEAGRAGVAMRPPRPSPTSASSTAPSSPTSAPGTQESWNLCIFAERQIDRSPTGLRRHRAHGARSCARRIEPGQTRLFRGISGEPFSGRISRVAQYGPLGAVHVEVGGRAFHAGRGEFVIEADDPLGLGFELARRFGDVRG